MGWTVLHTLATNILSDLQRLCSNWPAIPAAAAAADSTSESVCAALLRGACPLLEQLPRAIACFHQLC
jgi:hypothetical protein